MHPLKNANTVQMLTETFQISLVFSFTSALQLALKVYEPSVVSCAKGTGGTEGVGVQARMWMILSTTMLFSTRGKSSTVSLLPILGG